MISPTDLFADVIPFVHVAEALSFRRAGERLGVSTAAVSKAVARLEQRLAVKLLSRTSRAVALTPDGKLFLAHSKEAIASVELGRAQLVRSRAQPDGDIRVSASFILGPIVVAAMPTWTARYPKLVVHLELSDKLRGIPADDIDVALRVGARTSSTLVSRVLRRPRWMTVAAPRYLARRPRPMHPRELTGHDCVRFVDPRGRPTPWRFAAPGGGAASTHEVAGSLLVDEGNLLHDAALAGGGIAQLLDFMVGESVRDGRLVEVLSEFACEGPPIHAVMAPERTRSASVRAILELAVAAFA